MDLPIEMGLRLLVPIIIAPRSLIFYLTVAIINCKLLLAVLCHGIREAQQMNQGSGDVMSTSDRPYV